ncbi:MAG: D-aminoacyl-tRNA deacylase [Ignisphaera sp.]
MKIAIIYSLSDLAAIGIVEKLIENAMCTDLGRGVYGAKVSKQCVLGNVEALFLGFNDEIVYLNSLESLKGFDMFIAPSRHQSEARIPSLTVHVTGNPWRRSDFGGEPMTLSLSNPVLMWLILQDLYKAKNSHNTLSKFSVSYEVTHHGPTVRGTPITFVEIGSSENEWRDVVAQEIVAKAIGNNIKVFYSLKDKPPCRIAIGFGGSHYAPLFTRRALEKGECYGHMIPNYAIKELSVEDLKLVAEMAIEMTPNAQLVVIEKMRSEMKNAIIAAAKSHGLEYVVV